MPDTEIDGIDATLGAVTWAAGKDAVSLAIWAAALPWDEVVGGGFSVAKVSIAVEATAFVLEHERRTI